MATSYVVALGQPKPPFPFEGAGSAPAVAGVDFTQAKWPYTVGESFLDYAREHLVANGAPKGKIMRQVYVAMSVFGKVEPQRPVEKIERGIGREYAAAAAAEGKVGATARRELTLLSAWINHGRREGRHAHEVEIWKPAPGAPRIEVLSHEDEKRLFAVPKPRRAQIFLYLGINTGARAEAIEQLTWDRVNFARREIDYRVPGAVYKNKRRVTVPMNDTLLRRLTAAREYAQREHPRDPYVIGLGARGKPSTTYHDIAQCYKAIGLKVSAPRHILRHTFVTRLLLKRVPLIEVGRLVGDTTTMLEKTYAHFIPSDLLGVVNALND